MGALNTTVELVINGYACERDVTVRYEYSPAGGDGWHEPRYDAGATVCEVETVVLGPGLKESRINLMPLLTKEVLYQLEADCCQREIEDSECRASEAADWMRETERLTPRIYK